MALDPGGTTAVVGSQDGSVASFDLTGVRRLGQEVTTNARLSCAGNTYGPCDPVSPHTNLLADTRSDGTVEIVNLRTLHQVEILPDHNGPDDAVTWLPDGRTVVDGGLDGHVTLWDVKTGRLVRTLRFSDTVQNVAASPDCRLLAVQTQGARSSDYASSSSGSRPATYSRLTPWQTAAARSSSAMMGASSLRSAPVRQARRTSSPGTPAPAKPLFAPEDLDTDAFDISPDSRLLGVGTQDGKLLLIDPRTGKQAQPLLRRRRETSQTSRSHPTGEASRTTPSTSGTSSRAHASATHSAPIPGFMGT